MTSKPPPQARGSTQSTSSLAEMSFTDLYWVPENYTCRISDLKSKTYKLNVFQRIFLTFEVPDSCKISDVISYTNAIVIVISVVSIIVSSLRSFEYQPKDCLAPVCDNDPVLCPGSIICAPEILPVFGNIDFACVIFFTVDFVIRISLCGFMPTRLSGTISEEWDDNEREKAAAEGREPLDEPHYSFFGQFARYFLSFFTAVDLISILPTYIALGGTKNSANGLSSLRILRLLRAVRVMKISIRGRMMVSLLTRTMRSSQEAFAILLFYLSLVVIFFASIIFAVESGEYTVNDDYPDGEYLRPNGYGGTTNTPFRSIPTAMYYMIVTLTTVGYGDMFPTTIAGRALASVCCILGVLSLSLPISVISNNFTLEYQRYLEKKAEYEAVEKAKKLKVKRALENMRRKRASVNAEASRDGNISLDDDVSVGDRVPFSSEKEALVNSASEEGQGEGSPKSDRPSDDAGRDKSDTNDTSRMSGDRIVMNSSESKIELTARNSIKRSLSRSMSKLTTLERILGMSDDVVNSLDLESLQALFQELRGACQQLHSHNIKIASMASDLEAFAAKLQKKSVFIPGAVDDDDDDS